MNNKLFALLYDENGATSVEYAIMVSLIAAVIIFAVTALGIATNFLFSDAVNKFPEVE